MCTAGTGLDHSKPTGLWISCRWTHGANGLHETLFIAAGLLRSLCRSLFHYLT